MLSTKRLLETVLGHMFDRNNRQVGNTTVLAHLASQKGGKLICHNEEEAKRVRHTYDIQALSLEAIYRGFRGTSPLIFDPTSLYEVMGRALKEIDKQEREIKKLNDKINRICAILGE